jgi:hypothetical protein
MQASFWSVVATSVTESKNLATRCLGTGSKRSGQKSHPVVRFVRRIADQTLL